jgi:glycosyltransferase involved in cell wall biosynthesis
VAVAEGVCTADRIKVLAEGTINGIDAALTYNPERLSATGRAAFRAPHGIPPDAVVVGFVGRLVRDKGVAELARAWSELAVEFPALHLLVCGPVEDRDPVGAEVLAYLRADERVHLTGEVLDLPVCYAAMDVLVLPTYREGFPLVPMEASAMELPVVATAVPGCVDAVVDGLTGTLVPARDATALAAAVRRYVLEPELGRRHGQAGRARILADFRPEVVWAALHDEYQRLLRSAAK